MKSQLKNYFAVAALAGIISLLPVGLTYAHDGDSSGSSSGSGRSSDRTKSTEVQRTTDATQPVQQSGKETESHTESSGQSGRTQTSGSGRSEVRVSDDSKQDDTQSHGLKTDDLKTKIEDRKNAIKNHLEGDRLKKCQNKQDAINTVISNGKDRSQKVLTRLQNADSRVRSFYSAKDLKLTSYNSRIAAIDAAKATATDAVSAAQAVTFTCSSDDATNPGGIEKDTFKSVYTALDAYRQAIRTLIADIQAAMEPSTGSSTTEPEHSTAGSSTTTTSGGAQ